MSNTLCSSAEGAPRGFPPLSHAGWIPILFSLGDVSTDVFQSVRAGDGDRTRDKSLEGSHVTATPHPQCGSYMREEVVVVSLNAQYDNLTRWVVDCQQVRQDSNLQSTA